MDGTPHRPHQDSVSILSLLVHILKSSPSFPLIQILLHLPGPFKSAASRKPHCHNLMGSLYTTSMVPHHWEKVWGSRLGYASSSRIGACPPLCSPTSSHHIRLFVFPSLMLVPSLSLRHPLLHMALLHKPQSPTQMLSFHPSRHTPLYTQKNSGFPCPSTYLLLNRHLPRPTM